MFGMSSREEVVKVAERIAELESMNELHLQMIKDLTKIVEISMIRIESLEKKKSAKKRNATRKH